jgi:hypothetical protein
MDKFFKTILICSLISVKPSFSIAQQIEKDGFPVGWTGKWKGEMVWYQGKIKQQTIPMQLHVSVTDSTDQYTWRLIYGENEKDNRPYTIKPFDKTKGHWLVDEHNSIVLDLFQIGDRLCGSFTVEGNTIVNNYWLTGDSLQVEFYNIQEKPIAITGGGDSTIPKIKSYGIRSYQRAILRRINK